MTIRRLTRLALPAACALGLLAGPALAQTMAPSTPPAATAVPMAPSAPAPAAAPTTTAGMAPSTAPRKMSKSGGMKLPNSERFTTASAASASCPGDTVVWSTLSRSKSFHLASSKYYGKTKHGGYVCEKAAISAGYHQSKA